MNLATKITVFRVVLIPIVMLCMYLSNGQFNTFWQWTALIVFMIASASDFVDSIRLMFGSKSLLPLIF